MLNKIQYISQGNTPQQHILNIGNVLDAGCRWIQLRMKNTPDDIILKTADEAKKLCEKFGAIFILNDNPVLAKKIDSDGVHLGLNDMSVAGAREIIRKNKIIGGTANTIDDIIKRTTEGVDYIGLGPFRFTNTKQNLSPILGLEGYRNIIELMKSKNIEIPVYAIGGISESDVIDLAHTGIFGIAVSGMFTNKKNIKELIERLNIILNNHVNNSR